MEREKALNKLKRAKVEALSNSTDIKVGRAELNEAMKGLKVMISIEKEMERIAVEGYKEMERYNVLKSVIE